MTDHVSWSALFLKGFAFSAIVVGISFWRSSKLPTQFGTGENLLKEPVQTSTDKKPFETQANGHTYQIEPIYEYEISGLVVSDHASNSWFDNVHEQWNDYINTKDICVIWGKNVTNPLLSKLNFSHGAWTCYVSAKSGEVWSSFSMDQLSNNHLIPANPEIAKLIAESNIGDEIRIKGQLVNYSVNKGPQRKSSTIRTDTENGACEIIYVNEFETYAKNNRFWTSLFKLSKFASMLFLFAVLFSFFIFPFLANKN